MSADAPLASYPEPVALNRQLWHPSWTSALRRCGRPSALLAAVGFIVGCSVLMGMVGADARWLSALGRDVIAQGRIPHGVPFAAAPVAHWHNITVLGELVFWTFESAFGDRGLVVLQALAVALAFCALTRDAMRTGAAGQQVASTCLLAAIGAAPSLVIARAQLFSLTLFPILLLLLRADSRARSHRVWLIVPVLALWSNLHGAVLVGLAITLVYLGVARLRERPLETVGLAIFCVAALAANPGGPQAVAYYSGVLSNAAAQRGEGMWGPLSLASPADLLLIIAAGLLALRAARARPQLWEIVSIGLLGAMTVHAARSGIWMLLALIPVAAVGARSGAPWQRRRTLLAAAAIASLTVGVVRGPAPTGADHQTVLRTLALARGTPVLADDIEAEQIALGGGRVWASNPIDAFQPRVQVSYLEWMDGHAPGLAAVDRAVHIVLVRRGSPEAALMGHVPGFRVVASARTYELFERSTNR